MVFHGLSWHFRVPHFTKNFQWSKTTKPLPIPIKYREYSQKTVQINFVIIREWLSNPVIHQFQFTRGPRVKCSTQNEPCATKVCAAKFKSWDLTPKKAWSILISGVMQKCITLDSDSQHFWRWLFLCHTTLTMQGTQLEFLYSPHMKGDVF